jgi:NADH dehydrogenase FAD-containing subunit
MAVDGNNATFDLILLGGGHAHIAVLADWITRGLPVVSGGEDARVALITPSPFLRYSGMVPGWLSRQYGRDDGRVDLRGLAEKAGATFIEDRCVVLDPVANCVATQKSGSIPFRFCSVDTGGVGRAAKLLGDDPRLLDARPIDNFVEAIAEHQDLQKIAVVGGGGGGVEIAFALRNRERNREHPARPADVDAEPSWEGCAEVSLITGAEGLLPDFARGPREMVRRALEAQGITVLEHDAGVRDGALQTRDLPQTSTDDPLKTAQIIVAALGSGAPDWPAEADLDVDENGFVAVDKFQRSISHPHILASGDIAARQDVRVPRSGVHAVHTGPVLAKNLRAILAGKEPQESYRPRPASLYILSTADGEAIAVYGPVATKAEWASGLKGWIDKRWIASYAKLVGSM